MTAIQRGTSARIRIAILAGLEQQEKAESEATSGLCSVYEQPSSREKRE
jgi:hypothetical protein